MRCRNFRFLALLWLLPTPVLADDLVLLFTSAAPAGQVRAMVFNDAVAFAERQRPLAAVVLPVTAGRVRVTLSDLPPGRLAVAAYQDVNGDGRLNTSWLGMPDEPVGFSMTDSVSPDFDQAAFLPATGGTSVQIRLH